MSLRDRLRGSQSPFVLRLRAIVRPTPPPHVQMRVPLYHPDFPYILMWSQKAGCTTVVKWFFAQIGLLDAALARSRWVHDYESEVFKARPGYKADLVAALRSGRHRVAKVVRDPMARAPSAFLVLGERGILKTERSHWARGHWDLVDRWLLERGRDPAKGLSFLDHLAMLKDLEAAGPMAVNPHLAPQRIDGEAEHLDELVPIERFAAWADEAAVRHGLGAVDWTSLSESRHHHVVDPARTAALGERPEAAPILRGAYADRRFPASRAFINERSIPAIRDVYRADFAAYGSLYDP